MLKIFIIAALFYSTAINAQVETVLMGDFGPGIVVFRHYDRVGPNLNFENPPDILFHVGGRIPGRDNVQLDTVILNTRVGALWRNEVQPSAFQFPPNTAITEVVEVTATGYDIAINGRHYTYNHSMDVALVDRISTGQVNQLSIGKVLKHFSVGRVIYIKATAPSSGDFKINLLPLLPRDMRCQWSKVSLVFHTKFSATPPGVTRTSYGPTCGGVELGESDGGMPFVAGEQFQLTIVAQQFGFEIGVNGSHFASYAHRLPLSSHMTVMLTNVPAIETIQYY